MWYKKSYIMKIFLTLFIFILIILSTSKVLQSKTFKETWLKEDTGLSIFPKPSADDIILIETIEEVKNKLIGYDFKDESSYLNSEVIIGLPNVFYSEHQGKTYLEIEGVVQLIDPDPDHDYKGKLYGKSDGLFSCENYTGELKFEAFNPRFILDLEYPSLAEELNGISLIIKVRFYTKAFKINYDKGIFRTYSTEDCRLKFYPNFHIDPNNKNVDYYYNPEIWHDYNYEKIGPIITFDLIKIKNQIFTKKWLEEMGYNFN